ncbi:MAG: ABC transporter ATP-binding protein [Thermosulfidibacteraceae bacterium]
MIVKVVDLYFSYGQNEVLNGISFNMEKPILLGVIGSNGSGKTTLLRNISGYLKPNRGSVFLFDRNVVDIPRKERARLIGYVPQDIVYDFDFTAYEIVMMGRLPHLGRFQAERKIDREVVERSMLITDVWHLRDKPLRKLSGGERQRVYIARALSQEAKILLMDEPVAHLDIKYQLEILSVIRGLVERGIAVIIVLHDVNLASIYCDEIIVLKDGTILAKGKPEEVITEGVIREAFSIDVRVINPEDGLNRPLVIPNFVRKT